ncbi:glycosyltransferase family 24 protein [Aaosphaeria arxii CBS 175.79]|uniref:Glycosyltransferase family 24 protein n=1 Tax=Aaosphaeria arxii CBS 175.79 TaxID=1450172 RepID=A0A6A5XG65_9PLEO|nr:glycosyltransferase family 24 protein [Aaosphaeria arxii CBS 175.79]KAF2012225.1 glycosyltransferase family 24 protein [Aaosphaeria arxii CBS 175.79]
MRAFRNSLGLKGLCWLSAAVTTGVFGEQVKVELKAAFNSAPYLVELLETAAEEVPDAYFPLLDRIAGGWFDEARTDQQLHAMFIATLEADGHMPEPEERSSYQLALSVRSAAPRIEAHYQFYNTSVEPSIPAGQGSGCETWVAFKGKQYCDPELAKEHGIIKSEHTNELPFDRISGNSSHELPSILYADITSPSFAKFHNVLRKTAKEGKTSYRIRHKPSTRGKQRPLLVNGYGVELQLKRTDYIVIDDRDKGDKPTEQKRATAGLDTEHEVADLKPLSASEVNTLGQNAADFVLKSDKPLSTLLKLVQDFPKHSSSIAAHEVSEEFLNEHKNNRQQLLPSGMNVMWINGVQIPNRDINPFALLDHLRRERKLINGIRRQGLSGPEAINLLSNSAISENQADDEPQRYDFRDEIEGGNVIIWLNDIEKDKRYESWPTDITALLQRTYPGQLPSVRKDIHNVIVPVDFSSSDDVISVVDVIQNMVKRKVPIRWGLAPKTSSAGSVGQAKVVYHLSETYGLSAVMKYLDSIKENKKLGTPEQGTFDAAVKDAKLRTDRTALALAEVLQAESLKARTDGAKQYLTRLAATGSDAPFFVNGVALAQGDDWLSTLSQRISMDLRMIQRGVFEQVFTDDTWLPQYFLFSAATKRNPLIIPENEKNIILVDMAEFQQKYQEIFEQLPTIAAADSSVKKNPAHLTVIGDFDSESGLNLLKSAAEYRKENYNVELVLIHNPQAGAELSNASEDILESWIKSNHDLTINRLLEILAQEPTFSPVVGNSTLFWESAKPIVLEAFGLKSGQSALLLNGRYVGPIPEGQSFSKDDVDTLVSYETTKRIGPLSNALEQLQISDKIALPFDFAKLQSLVSLSTISDVPEGIFETASTVRTSRFNVWNDAHTAIIKGDNATAVIQIVVSLDPATELAQKWVPILNVLSEMKGVYLKLFLNPKDSLQELPVKRFYRYVLNSEPMFDENGDLKSLAASFLGIPQDALLNLGMDVPPSWLVAPEESVHDLDNIKLRPLGYHGIKAVYGLESILIEGHSRDVTNGGQPPRGAELVLSTDKDPHFADTIIMANLGYFQFKANPGFFKIQLKGGRSQEIFTIDSAGPAGWAPVPGDETSEIALMSFQGATLFPRLSRKPGQEEADVLGSEENVAAELVEKGTQKVNKLLGKIGLGGFNTDKVQKALSKKSAGSGVVQAEINIFSVASGHLYERMLNIMMLSVMKHTKHTVKFWFIEQFLSPSFKTFLPAMAAEYGFQYEMVTYKWPHWLRGQTEKQREIWGYKILFLDVLFPLDLDKVIFVDADQIVRTDMYELVQHDLQGAPYGFTPMCDSRTEMEGFRFWKQGYWANFLRGLPYHISALYVVDLKRFRQIAAGDRLRQQYHSLSADPNSLSNLDQDLPNNMQFNLPIHSLPQEWLWCETWCSDESLKDAKTIDLCNNPQTKEPKLDRARRQVPEWTTYDDEIAALAKRVKGGKSESESESSGESEGKSGSKGSAGSHGEPQAWGGERVKDEL